MLKQLRSGWSQLSQLRDSRLPKNVSLSFRDIKYSDIKRTILARGSMKGRMQVVLGWVLVGVGIVGIVMPVIPGAFLLVVGSAMAGWRHPLVEKLAEPMFRLSDSLPEEKIPAPLRPLWAGWRKLDVRRSQSQSENAS